MMLKCGRRFESLDLMSAETKNCKKDNILVFESLIEYCLDLPLSFAIWKNQGDYVLISSKMQSLLKFQSLAVSSVDFVRGVSSIFGDFLYDAVEKLSEAQFANRKYSINFSTKYNKSYCITLRYNIRSDIYIFTAVDSNSQQNSSVNDVYAKKVNSLNEKIEILNELLNSLPVYIWQKNKNSKIIYCNKKYASALGTTVSDVVNNNRQLFKTQSLCSTQNCCNQTDLTIKINGQDKNIELTEFISATNADNVLGFANECIDVEALQNNTERINCRLSNVIDNVSDGVALFGVDDRLIACNEVSLTLFNMTLPEIENKTFVEIIDLIILKEQLLNNDKQYRNSLIKLIKDIKTEPVIKTVRLSNNKTIRISICVCKNKELLFLFSDITINLSKEHEVHSVRSVYQNILNNINDGILIFGSDNRIKFANSPVYGVLNQSVSSLNEWHMSDCFDKVKYENTEVFIENLLKSSEMRISKSEVVAFSDKTFECIYVPLPDGLNLLRFKDLSDFRLLEKDLQNASEKVAQINELKNSLITAISDEYTAPIDTIMNLAEILSNKYFGELNEKQMEYCQSVIKTAGRLKDTADAVTNIALIQTDKVNFVFEETDINDFIQSIVDNFLKVNPEYLIKFEPSHPPFNAYVDANFMRKAIHSIIVSLIYRNEQEHDIVIKVYRIPKNDVFFGIEITDKKNDILEEEIERYNHTFLKDFCLGDLKTIELGYTLANIIIGKHSGNLSINSSGNNETTVKIQLQIQRFLS